MRRRVKGTRTMKKRDKEELQLSPELQELLDNTPSTKEAAAQLRQDFIDLESDPEFVAGFLKMQFVEDIFKAMHEQGINRNQLAAKLGKSRQYVGRILNENANFTLETLAEFACALDMHVSARLYARDEHFAILPTLKRPQIICNSGFIPEATTVDNTTGEEDAGHLAA